MPLAKPKKASPGTIAQNKKARFEYHIHEKFEAGLVLQGWEVKSIRAGRIQLTDTYVFFKQQEAFLLGANITPLHSASTHVTAESQRIRKLLLNRREIARLIGSVQQKGFTCVPMALYWKGPLVKCELALASGKKEHDKRATIKERDWQRDKQRIAKDYRR